MKKFFVIAGMISIILTSCGKMTDVSEQVHESDIWLTEPVSETEEITQYSGISEQDDDIGEVCCKEPLPEEILIDEETGLQYVKNQLLISTFIGTEFSKIKDIAEEINAEIVGYIELTGDYQLAFKEEKTLEELDKIADDINRYSFISNVTLNLVYADTEETAP